MHSFDRVCWNAFIEFQSLVCLCHALLNAMKITEALTVKTYLAFQVYFLYDFPAE